MRTTLTIDDDVLAVARRVARNERISVGAAISRLARNGFYADRSAPTSEPPAFRNGVPVFPATGTIVTEDHVEALREAEGV